MAQLSDLKLRYRIFMRRYQYRTVDWSPGATLSVPLSESRVAAVTTAAFYLPNQPPFDNSIKGGDFNYREVTLDSDWTSVRVGHQSDAFDPEGITRDPNLALPLDRLAELSQEGVIGSIAPRHFSFMGSITAPGRLIDETAPRVAAALKEDGVGAVLLTPV